MTEARSERSKADIIRPWLVSLTVDQSSNTVRVLGHKFVHAVDTAWGTLTHFLRLGHAIDPFSLCVRLRYCKLRKADLHS
jgi:hypothetical protein